MLSILTSDDLDRAAADTPDLRLRALLLDRRYQFAGEMTDLTHLLVIVGNDTEADILEASPISPLTNPIDGCRFGQSGFTPWWDWLQRHDGWFELIITVGNTGYAYVFLILDSENVLLPLCHTYAGEGA